MWVWLRLKLIADVGLVGFPNVGKSTLLSLSQNAKTKVGNYPFTTLKPQLGVLTQDYKDLIIADLPGLVENASDGIGLGLKFPAHIERCAAILHVCDISNDIKNYLTIKNELAKYNDTLNDKEEIIVLSKCDTAEPDKIEKCIETLKKISKSTIIPVSSHTKFSITNLKSSLMKIFNENSIV